MLLSVELGMETQGLEEYSKSFLSFDLCRL